MVEKTTAAEPDASGREREKHISFRPDSVRNIEPVRFVRYRPEPGDFGGLPFDPDALAFYEVVGG